MSDDNYSQDQSANPSREEIVAKLTGAYIKAANELTPHIPDAVLQKMAEDVANGVVDDAYESRLSITDKAFEQFVNGQVHTGEEIKDWVDSLDNEHNNIAELGRG